MSELITFGKYSGKPVDEMLLDQKYCGWLFQQPWLRVKHAAIHSLLGEMLGGMANTPQHNKMQVKFLSEDYRIKFAMAISDVKECGLLKCRKIWEEADRIRQNIPGYREWIWSGVNQKTSEGCSTSVDDSYLIKPVGGGVFEEVGSDYLTRYEVGISGRYECSLAMRVDEKTAYGYDVSVPNMEHPFNAYYDFLPRITNKYFAVEMKPTVADEFPMILRQIKEARKQRLKIALEVDRNYRHTHDEVIGRLGTAQLHIYKDVLLVGEYIGDSVSQDDFVAFMKNEKVEVIFESDVDRQRIDDARFNRRIFIEMIEN